MEVEKGQPVQSGTCPLCEVAGLIVWKPTPSAPAQQVAMSSPANYSYKNPESEAGIEG